METNKRFFAAPVFEDEEKSRNAYLLNFITIAYFLISFSAVAAAFFASSDIGRTMREALIRTLPLLIVLVITQILMRIGRVTFASFFLGILLWLTTTFSMYVSGGASSSSIFVYVLVVMVFGLLTGRGYAIISAVAAFIMVIVALIVENMGLLPASLSQQDAITSVFTFFVVIFLSTSLLYLYRVRLDESLANLHEANLALERAGEQLERRVTNATRNLELAAEVGQRLSMVRETGIMLTEAVEMIGERFDLYYTQVYLTDPTGRTLILRAGTGEAGQTLLRRGHRLPVDMSSLNGIATTERRPLIVEDTEASSLHRPNPLLPDTRSEMVIPLLVSERVVGVLDMQSVQPGALSAENLPAFEALAGQLAIAIANTRLFEEAEQARLKGEEQARRLTNRGWHDFMDAIQRSERIAYTFDLETVTPFEEPLLGVMDETTLAIPIQVSGEPIGTFQFEREAVWTKDDHTLVNTIAQQVSQQVENLRLLAQAEQYQAEAQEALKRLTHEGWKSYQDQFIGQNGYVYQDHEVKPLAESSASFADALRIEIKVRNETIGELAIDGVGELSEENAGLVAYVNEQLSAHLENIRLSQQTEQALATTEEQAQRLAALNELSEQLVPAQTLEEIYKISTPILNQIISADRSSLSRWASDQQSLELFALQGEAGAVPTGTKLSLEGSAVGTSVTERRVIFIPDAGKSSFVDGQTLTQQGLKSSMVIPLIVGGKAIGTLNFDSTALNAYGERESELAVQAAAMIASTIENRGLLEQTRLRAQREQDLRQIATQVRTFVDPDLILRTAARELGEKLGRKVIIQMGGSQIDQQVLGIDLLEKAATSLEK